MKSPASLWRALALFVTLAVAAPSFAQTPVVAVTQKSPAPPAAPAAPLKQSPSATPVAFDTLLAADSYAIYGEVRGVGRYVNSKEITDLIAPLGLPASGAPPELLDLFSFLRAHAEALTTARVMVAGMPVRPKLPDVFAAVEMSSPEQAQKFETELRKFLTTHAEAIGSGRSSATPTGPDGAGTPGNDAPAPNATRRGRRRAGARANDKPVAPPPPFHLVRAGSLLVVSDTQFKLASLRPTDAPLLTDEPGFAAARSRFAHETLFVYFNTRLIERNSEQQRAKAEREATRQRAEEMRRLRKTRGTQGNEDATTKDDEANSNANSNAVLSVGDSGRTDEDVNANSNVAPPTVESVNESVAVVTPVPTIAVDPALVQNEVEGTPEEEPKKLSPEEEAQAQQQRAAQQLMSALPMLLFNGGPFSGGSNTWPESIAAAVELEDDALVARVLLVREAGDEKPPRPIPFLPLLLSAAIVPEAARVVPADTDILVSASLDLPQMYDYVASMLKILDVATAATSGRKDPNNTFEFQLGAFEKTSGFRIKEDLIAALGNELAIALPAQTLGLRSGRTTKSGSKNERAPSGPVFIVALNDRKALQALLLRVLKSAGLQGLSEQQLYEKRGEVELLTLAQGSVAFVDRFLVLAPDAATMQRVIDGYNNRETLAGSEAYNNSARWQPRQVLGQIYVSSALLKAAFDDPKAALEDIEDTAVRDVLLRLGTEPGAITHALAKDDQGLVHELHVPKDVLSLMAAEALIGKELGPLRSREAQARWALQSIVSRQEAYKQKHGRYGSLEDLKHTLKNMPDGTEDESIADDESEFNPQADGYEIKLNVSGDKFEATATPELYRKTGRRSFYVDQTGVVRAADTGGKPADANAPAVD